MNALDLQTIRAADGMAALADEWNALADRCRGYLLSQTHQWASVAWHAVARTRGRRLEIVAGRADGKLVAVWPLVSYRTNGVRLVRPLGSEATDYCAPLVEPGCHHEEWMAALWRRVSAIGDVVYLPHVDLASSLAKIAVRDGGLQFADRPVRAPFVARHEFEDWPSYLQTVSTSHRSGLRRKRRRLAELGEVTFERASPGVAACMIGWMLDHKQHWLARRELRNDWLDRADFQEFLRQSVSSPGRLGSLSLFVVRVGGTPVAVQLNSIDRTRMEFLIGAHDASYAIYSPGEIATEECLRWAFDHELDYDFRLGDEAYKLAWAKRWRSTSSLQVATGLRGVPFIVALHIRDQIHRLRFRLGIGRLLPASLRARFRQSPRTDR